MHTYLAIPCTVPPAYWEGYFAEVDTMHNVGGEITHFLVRSMRGGADGTSDARYVKERCASGLHFGITTVWPIGA